MQYIVLLFVFVHNCYFPYNYVAVCSVQYNFYYFLLLIFILFTVS